MTELDERLFRDVDSCVLALESMLSELSASYSPLAVVIAMALHSNAMLRAAVKSGQFDGKKAQELLIQLAALEVDPRAVLLTKKMSSKKN